MVPEIFQNKTFNISFAGVIFTLIGVFALLIFVPITILFKKLSKIFKE